MTREALLEIDFQPWIIEIGHSDDVVDHAVEVRRQARSRGALVIASRYLSHDPEDPLRSDRHGPGARFHPLLAPEPGDLVITKYERDVFSNPDLPDLLELNKIGRVTVTGVATDHGVQLAALSAKALGYDVAVVAPACAATSVEAQERTLNDLSKAGVAVLSA